MFAVLSIASLFEKKEGNECRAHDYFVLSRVALTFDTPVTTTTVMSVQAMVSPCSIFTRASKLKRLEVLHGSVFGDA